MLTMSKTNLVNNNHSNKTLITFLIAMMTYNNKIIFLLKFDLLGRPLRGLLESNIW